MRAVLAAALVMGIDTLSTISGADSARLVAQGMKFRIGYIDHVTPEELGAQLDAGLPFSPVTYALEFDPAHTVARLEALAIPKGVTVWLDVEGVQIAPDALIAKINAWSAAVEAGGWQPGLYVGAGCPLTSSELSALRSVRYMQGCSRLLDRNGAPQVPSRGYCVIQLRPDDVMLAGVKVDVDVTQADYRGDLPTFAVADAA